MSWKIDPSHSEVTFSVRHMMISTVRGRFEKFTGTVDFNEADPSLSTVDVQIEAAQDGALVILLGDAAEPDHGSRPGCLAAPPATPY